MPRIDFNFQGYLRGANVEEVWDISSGEEVDVSKMSAEDVVKKLKAGEYSLSLVEYLHEDVLHTEIELDDYEVSKQ